MAEIYKKSFEDHMSKGNINVALNLLTNNIENEVLPLSAEYYLNQFRNR